jgi:hypothetical protein
MGRQAVSGFDLDFGEGAGRAQRVDRGRRDQQADHGAACNPVPFGHQHRAPFSGLMFAAQFHFCQAAQALDKPDVIRPGISSSEPCRRYFQPNRIRDGGRDVLLIEDGGYFPDGREHRRGQRLVSAKGQHRG